MLIRSVARVLVTDVLMSYRARLIRDWQFFPVTGGVLVILGLALCYFGDMA